MLVRAFRRPIITSRELFRAVLEASDRFRANEKSLDLAFYFDHALQTNSGEDYLPVAADKTFLRYARRLATQARGRRFALIIEDIQAFSPSLWARLRAFLRPLDETIPNAGTLRKATVFIGDYVITPSGLHVGTSGNFKFVVQGSKRMRLWPDQFFRRRRGVNHTKQIEPFLPHATTLRGRAGDIIYWPSDQWHVGDSLGGLAVSVSLAIFVKSRASEGPVTRLNRQTGAGFARVPPSSLDRTLADHALVRCDSCYPIIWQEGKHGEIICSGGGHAFSFKIDNEILELLTRLNLGKIERVGDLIARRPALRVVLEKLLRLRAISAVREKR